MLYFRSWLSSETGALLFLFIFVCLEEEWKGKLAMKSIGYFNVHCLGDFVQYLYNELYLVINWNELKERKDHAQELRPDIQMQWEHKYEQMQHSLVAQRSNGTGGEMY